MVVMNGRLLRVSTFALIVIASMFATQSGSAQSPRITKTPNPFEEGSEPITPQNSQPVTPQEERTSSGKQKPAEPPAAASQFTSEADAKSHCPGDTVVWVNTNSKIYHYTGTPAFGATKRGAYVCEKETSAAGFRAAKNEIPR
jgi:hypothetical protein